jgi:hypothetical protein
MSEHSAINNCVGCGDATTEPYYCGECVRERFPVELPDPLPKAIKFRSIKPLWVTTMDGRVAHRVFFRTADAAEIEAGRSASGIPVCAHEMEPRMTMKAPKDTPRCKECSK